MPEIVIKTDGVEKLLRNLSPHKASGPDSLPNTILNNCATELAPVISDIFRQSLDSGSLPSDLRNANISPAFKQEAQRATYHAPEYNVPPFDTRSARAAIFVHSSAQKTKPW